MPSAPWGDYDFILEYPASRRAPHRMNDAVSSPVVDGAGTEHVFTGKGVVVATSSSALTSNYGRCRKYSYHIRVYPPVEV